MASSGLTLPLVKLPFIIAASARLLAGVTICVGADRFEGVRWATDVLSDSSSEISSTGMSDRSLRINLGFISSRQLRKLDGKGPKWRTNSSSLERALSPKLSSAV